MDRDLHEEANEQIYASGEGVERVDHSLVVKGDENHFPVMDADGVPLDTLVLPDDVLAATQIDNPPTPREVLVAKAERTAQLLEWFTPYTLPEPDYA